MNRFTIWMFSLVTFLTGDLMWAQPYTLRSLQVEDGLSQNMVYCVIQDRDDYIWIGTQDGLNRYDGNSFKVYKKTDGSGLFNDGVCSLNEDHDGNIWVGTIAGLHIFNPSNETFRFVPLRDISGNPIDGLVRDIEFGPEGEAYVAIADTCLIRIGRDFTSRQISLGEKGRGINIRDLQTDSAGNLWIASYAGGLLELQGKDLDKIKQYPFKGKSGQMFTKVKPLDNETLLVGSVDYGVLKFHLRNKSFTNVDGMGAGDVNFVHDILVASDGRVWVGAENGVHISDPSGITRLVHTADISNPISDNAVFCLTEDIDGGVWIGTYFGGVNYYSPYSSLFQRFVPVPGENRLRGKNISEFCLAGDGSIWIGTEDAGLHRFYPDEGRFESGFLPAGNIHALKIIDNKLWVGSYGQGLFVLSQNGRNYRKYSLDSEGGGPGGNSAYSIFKDLSGTIWIGTERGLFQYNASADRFYRVAEDLIYSHVNDILQDFYGRLWFATMGQGVFRLDPETGIWLSLGDMDPYISCMLEDSAHDIWLGTEDSGIIYYNHKTGESERRWTEEDGLPNNMIYMLLEDNSGGIWGSTNHGLFHLTPNRDRVIRFDHRSGLTGDQFNFKSGMKAPDGTLYFGGVKGFVSFRPESFNYPPRPSKIVFSRFNIYNSEVKRWPKDAIVLRPDQKMFSIGFADLDYSSFGIKTYQYRLLGQDKDWINIEQSHLISFSNLPSGRYRLEVRANPLNAAPGDPVKGLDIRIMPPWYRRAPAIIGEVIIILFLLYLLGRFVASKIRKLNQEAVERELERRRAAATPENLKFMDRVKNLMEENLSNPSFNVNTLVDELHMSRSTLYRKMRVITDIPVNDYIKQYRLNKAAKLIAEKTWPIAEVASMVGFNSLSYFSRCFHAQFGVSPKDYKA